ncbi:hypothetical protein HK405_009356, partial [Cladochytrium tenue]
DAPASFQAHPTVSVKALDPAPGSLWDLQPNDRKPLYQASSLLPHVSKLERMTKSTDSKLATPRVDVMSTTSTFSGPSSSSAEATVASTRLYRPVLDAAVIAGTAPAAELLRLNGFPGGCVQRAADVGMTVDDLVHSRLHMAEALRHSTVRGGQDPASRADWRRHGSAMDGARPGTVERTCRALFCAPVGLLPGQRTHGLLPVLAAAAAAAAATLVVTTAGVVAAPATYACATSSSSSAATAAYAASTTAGTASASATPSPPPNVDPYYVNPFPMSLCNGLPLEDASVSDIQAWLTEGALTSVQLVQCYLQRIDQIDSYVGAIMELNPDALDIAAQMDEERAQGSVRGPLHGIPFLVKDNFATDDKVATTAGTVMLLGSKVPRDAHVVALLRKAGAVLLGHSNMSEWADMRSTSYSEGYSARRGQTRNAYNLTQEPGGSSSGSGVAVTSNMVTFALGTETDGSIVSPAERESLIGLKTTRGLTSRAGVIPESSNQDTVGILARSFADAAAVLSVIHGVDDRDNVTYSQLGSVPADGNYSAYVADGTSPLKGARFGLPWARVWEAASTKNQLPQLLEALRLIEAAGATIYNNTDYPSYQTSVSPNG